MVTFETKMKWPYKTDDLLKEVQFIGQEKGDLLIQVTAWADFTVCLNNLNSREIYQRNNVQSSLYWDK